MERHGEPAGGPAGAAAVGAELAGLAATAAARAGVPHALLEGFLPALLAVARTGRRISAEEEAASRRTGARAVAMGVGLPDLVDVHMGAARRLWPRIPDLVGALRGRPVRSSELIGIGEAVWRAADTALAALTGGYQEEQQLVVRREEAARQEFVEDLLTGRSDVATLLDRAEPYGLRLAAGHVVVVVEAEGDIDSVVRVAGAVEDAARLRFPGTGLLVAAKDGGLVCVLGCSPSTRDDRGHDLADLAGAVVARSTPDRHWRAGVGRAHAGPRAVQRSFGEAREALDLARRLDLPQQVVEASELLVYRVLARDETAIADLVRAVLEPLTVARGGAEPFVRTLEAYFAAGGNAAATARELHLSVRAVTYRLARIAELCGYDPANPGHHLVLHVAVTGARLLDWPRRALVRE
ncbi:PucR family transcriptional regulator [Blastococcus sp. SYSU D01042]